MNIVKDFLKNNNCYKQGKVINPIGIVVHDVGCEQTRISRFTESWNKPNVEKMVHAFIGKDDDGNIIVRQTMPWNYRSWGCSSGKNGSFNNTHIQFEICRDLDDLEYSLNVYNIAIELCSMLINEFPSIKIENIVGHYEAHKLGYASNHADPGEWFPKFNKSMDIFRNDVKNLNSSTSSTTSTTSNTNIKQTKYKLYTVDTMPNAAKIDMWVKKLQKEIKAYQDGKYGSKTLSKCPQIKYGMKSNIVRLIQERLKSLGYNLKIDGEYGKETKNAIISYESKLGFNDSTGTINKAGKTWSALLLGYK